MLRFGQRVSVLAWACDPLWRTDARPRTRRPARVRLRPRLRAPCDGRPLERSDERRTTTQHRHATCRRDLAIGIDVGGTNTDAVALDGRRRVVAWTKQRHHRRRHRRHPGGARRGPRPARRRPEPRHPRHARHHPRHQRDRRPPRPRPGRRHPARRARRRPRSRRSPAGRRTCATSSSPGRVLAGGGHLVDGYPIAPLDRDAHPPLPRRRSPAPSTRSPSAASSARRSPSRSSRSRRWSPTTLGVDVPVSLSHEIGALGLLERENATVLNAVAVRRRPRRHRTRSTVGRSRSTDSTRPPTSPRTTARSWRVEYAARYPVLTIGSGPGELHPRRRLPLRCRRRDHHRRRRHDERPRRARRRVPARVDARARDRRRAHQLPDARHPQPRDRRRHPRPRRGRRSGRRPRLGRLRAEHGRACSSVATSRP